MTRPTLSPATTLEVPPMTLTALAVTSRLDGPVERDNWTAFIADGGYGPEQAETLVKALFDAQRTVFEASLPDGCFWEGDSSRIVGPVGTELGDLNEVVELLREAAQDVVERFAAIEARALAGIETDDSDVTL